MEKRNYKKDMKCHFLLCMPDGGSLGLWVPKSEKLEEYINKFFDNWHKVTKDDPRLFGHIVLEEKCPNCGEALHAKEYDNETRCWCPSCHYMEVKVKR